jgi:ADP-ribosylglycohydrolase
MRLKKGEKSMNEKLKAAVYGFAVGDALGVPFEFKQRGTFKCKGMIGFGTWNQEPGTWSDDTSMVLATCDSIRKRGGIDLNEIMCSFVRWKYLDRYTAHNDVFDVGETTDMAIRAFAEGGKPIAECGLRGEWSNGNGSLMRILPLAFVPDVSWTDVANVSGLTHAHAKSVAVCCEFVHICKKLLQNPHFPIPDRIARMKRKDVSSSGYVVTTLEAALWCFGTSRSYKEAVLKAVNLGGDTDTIAALTGALAALKWGYDAIPQQWIDTLANKKLIDSCLF